jgi:hypothetical protein
VRINRRIEKILELNSLTTVWYRWNVGHARYDVRISSLLAAIIRKEGRRMNDDENHGPARRGLLPNSVGGDLRDADPEWAEYVAWADREAAAGRVPEPEPWAFGDEEPWDPLPWDPDPDDPDPATPTPSPSPSPSPAAPATGGPGRALFAEDGAGDLMAPSPFLAALTEQAVADVACLSDTELVGVLRASRRLVAREQYKQVLAAAEFGRRRQAAFEAALARGVPAGCAAGGFPGEELAIELAVSRAEAGHLIDDAIDLTGRLPRTLAGMAAGLIDAGRAGWIAMYTRSLNPADTAHADQALAEMAPELRTEQLTRKAAALEMKLNPDAVKARREKAKRDAQRVEARRESSGNACLAGRELDTATCWPPRRTSTRSRPGCASPGYPGAWTGCGRWR